jgi:type IV secretion system protein TrbL
MNQLTVLLDRFIGAFSGGYANLMPSINSTLSILIAIELALLGLWWAVSGQDQLGAVLRKVVFIGFWIWFVRNFNTLADHFVQSLVKAGFTAAGSSGGMQLLLNPSRIAEYALDATMPIAKAISDANVLNIGTTCILGLSFVILTLAYYVIAIQIFLTVLEYYLVMAVAGVLLPWGVLPQTKFLAEKAIGAVVSAAIKMMVLSFLIAVADPILSRVSFGNETDFLGIVKTSWSIILTVGAIAFLAWNAPGLAAGLMSGSPSLSAGGAMQNAAAGASLALGAAGGAAAGVMKLASAASGGAAHAAGVISAGARSASGPGGGMFSAIGGGLRAAGASLVQSSVGRFAGSVQDHLATRFDDGKVQGEDAVKNPLRAPVDARAQGAGQLRGNQPAWAARASQALRKLPTEARPSGGGGARI